MKLGKNLPPPSKSDKRILAVSIVIFLASVVIVILAVNSRSTPHQPLVIGQSVATAVGTSASPEIIAKLTAMPGAQPLTGPLADEVHAMADRVASCPDYSPARRDQMNQHIAWLLQPATLPKEMIIALGSNTTGRLIFGMATFTLAEWGEKQKATDSCLLIVGKKLNDMLLANGEAPFTEFDEAAG